MKRIGQVRIKVEYLLEYYPHTRSSDKELQIKYLEIYHGGVSTNSFRACPPMESITRARRKIQEDGKYTATKAAQDGRAENEDFIHNWSKA